MKIKSKHADHDKGLFSVKGRVGGSKKKITRRKNKKTKVENGDARNGPKRIEEDLFHTQSKLISYEDLEIGQCFLGCIAEIKKYQMTLSLPNKMQGFLPITNISEAYKNLLVKVSEDKDVKETVYMLNELYSVGQIMVVKVKSLLVEEGAGGRVKVILSAMPEDVNACLSNNVLAEGTVVQGAIKSTEDNGFMVDTGIKNVLSAFLPLNPGSKESVKGVGNVLLCAVSSVMGRKSDSDTARLKLLTYTLRTCKAARARISSIIPGTVIKAIVEEVMPGGLKLSTAWNQGVVSWKHLKGPDDKLENYSVGQEVKARILYVTDISSVLHCTLNSKICSQCILKDPLNGLEIGDVIENSRIRSSAKHGVYVTLPNNCLGFCPTSKLADNFVSEEYIKKHFPVDSYKACRIIAANYIDQMFIIGFKKSVLSDELYSRKKGTENLQVGQKLQVQIREYNDHGAVVLFNKSVRGFVPRLHLPDCDEKTPVGTILTGRILNISHGYDPYLTLKTELVNSEETIVNSYNESNVGIVVAGCVIKVFDSGLLMELFGGLRAFIRKSNLSHSLKELSSVFEGMVLKCKIGSVDVEECKMAATLDVEDNMMKMLNVGLVVKCQVLSVEQDKVFVKMDQFGMEAYIPKCHLSDDLEISDSFYQVLKERDVIDNVVVYCKEESTIVLSAKPSVYQHVCLNKESINNDIASGYICPAVIIQIQDDEIKVSILRSGRSESSQVLSKQHVVKRYFKSLVHSGLRIGETLYISCLKVQNELPVFSSLLSRVMQDTELGSLQFLYNTLCVEKQLQTLLTRKGPSMFRNLKPGKSYKAKVIAVSSFGALVSVQSLGLDGVIRKEHYEGGAPSLGETIEVTLLHVDYREHCLELTARSDLKTIRAVKDHKMKIGDEGICQVLLAKGDFILTKLTNRCSGQLVYLPSRRHWNDFKDRSSAFEIDERYEVVIKHISEEIILGVPIEHCSENPAAVTLNTKLPEVRVKGSIPASALHKFALSASATKFDFTNKAKEKILQVTQPRQLFKTNTISNSEAEDVSFKAHKRKNYESDDSPAKRFQKAKQSTATPSKELRKNDNDWQITPISGKNDSKQMNGKIKKAKVQENSTVTQEDCLQVASCGFDWTGSSLNDKTELEAESSSDEDQNEKEQKTVKRKTKFERIQQAKAEEVKVRELELQRLDPDREPETALDFEEKIERNPHSSSVWIEYVSFYLANAETDKAKGVAARALQVVPPNLEEDRLALWNVALRLEVMYGTPESVDSSFKEALATNDELKIFYIMLDIYANANKLREAENVIHRMTKKYSQDKEVWAKAFMYFFKANELTEARNIFDKSLLCLPKQDHLDIIRRFAQLEMKYGDAERGKTIFEKIISNFPRRMDIWNVYADLLIKMKDVKSARNVLERMTGLKLRMKTMRTVFKKFLDFEKQFGTSQSVEAVKTKVEEYVASALKE